MRVLHIETGRHFYGGAVQVFYLVRGLAHQGISNVVVCNRYSSIAERSLPYAKVYACPMAGEADLPFFFRLLKIIDCHNPSLIHVHSRKGADLWGGIAAKISRLPALITRRVDNPERPWVAKVKYGLYDRVIAISQRIRDVLLAEGIPRQKLMIIHSAVEFERYDRPCNRNWFYNQFPVGPGEKVVGMVAQFIPRKGHKYLVDVIAQVTKNFPNTKFIFFGQGPLRKSVEKMCIQRGITRWVHFAGFREDLYRIFPCLDILVHPATMEGLGVSLLEAGASGIPVIAFRAGGVPEIIEPGETGFLIEPGDVRGLTSALVTLLQDNSLAVGMGSKARERTRRFFSTETMVDAYMKLYNQILQTGKP